MIKQLVLEWHEGVGQLGKAERTGFGLLKPATIEEGDTVTVPIYLDYNATTPVDPKVADAIETYLLEQYHAWNQTARGAWIGRLEFETLRELIQEHVTTLLDVGCGTGYFQ